MGIVESEEFVGDPAFGTATTQIHKVIIGPYLWCSVFVNCVLFLPVVELWCSVFACHGELLILSWLKSQSIGHKPLFLYTVHTYLFVDCAYITAQKYLTGDEEMM